MVRVTGLATAQINGDDNNSLDDFNCEYPDSTRFENKISDREKLPKRRNADFSEHKKIPQLLMATGVAVGFISEIAA